MDSNGQVIGSSYVETPAMSQSYGVPSPSVVGVYSFTVTQPFAAWK